MKKYILIIVTIMSLGLVACGSSGGNTTPVNSDPSDTLQVDTLKQPVVEIKDTIKPV